MDKRGVLGNRWCLTCGEEVDVPAKLEGNSNMSDREYGVIAAYLRWECFRCGVLRELDEDGRLLAR